MSFQMNLKMWRKNDVSIYIYINEPCYQKQKKSQCKFVV